MSDSPRRPSPRPKKSSSFPTDAGHLPDEGCPGPGASTSARPRTCAAGPARTSTRRPPSDRRICDWIGEVADIDFLAADSEVDALLMEARLIKDIQPKYNRDLKDDKTFPYLQITTGEDFPRVNFTREPLDRGVKLYGPFPRAKSLRGAIQVLQRIFKFRTCSLDIEEDDPRWRWFRPCLLALDQPVYGPVQPADRSRELPRRHPPPAAVPRRQEGRPAQGDGRGDARGEQGPPVREGGPASRRDQGARDPQPAGQPRRACPARGLLRRSAQGPEGPEADPEARLDSAHDRRGGHRPPGRQRDGRLAGVRSSTACRSSRAIAGTRSRAWRASTTSRRSARWSRGGSRACRSATSPSPTSG